MADRPRVLIVIPARFASSRFPGKALAPLRNGAGEAKPLIQWTWETATRSRYGDIVVATDDTRIAEAVKGFGGEPVMTSTAAANGTARCAEVAAATDAELIINLQGDSPLVPPSYIDALVEAWQAGGAPVLTAYISCDAPTERQLLDDAAAGRVGGTTLVINAASRALYFSKAVIPHRSGGDPALKLHVGLYAYTPAALAAYAAHPASGLELAEGLEQLRFLDMGHPIQAVSVPPPPGGLWEVNNPEDVPLVEAALRVRAMPSVAHQPHSRAEATDLPERPADIICSIGV
jgi:3-deoxy-manno-octulosonate cytidylyltransferase (CMP-KDO synthetase)